MACSGKICVPQPQARPVTKSAEPSGMFRPRQLDPRYWHSLWLQIILGISVMMKMPIHVAADLLPAASTVSLHTSLYIELLPPGCCRNATGGSGPHTQYFFDKTNSECQALCDTRSTCLGYESNTNGKCELHADNDFNHTNPDPACRCVLRLTSSMTSSTTSVPPTTGTSVTVHTTIPTATPTTATPTTATPTTETPTTAIPSTAPSNAPSVSSGFTYVELTPRGCCRNATGGSGPNTQYFFGRTGSECEALCTSSPPCRGYEITASGKCELHADDDFAQTHPDATCRCVQRVASSALDNTFGDIGGSTAAQTWLPAFVMLGLVVGVIAYIAVRVKMARSMADVGNGRAVDVAGGVQSIPATASARGTAHALNLAFDAGITTPMSPNGANSVGRSSIV
eukprot:m.132361 g.132361  ORF g.132361 m.132361 type:complete len:398 (-) comp17496_c1_seq4:162-1355(-)